MIPARALYGFILGVCLQACTHIPYRSSNQRAPASETQRVSPPCSLPMFSWTHHPVNNITAQESFRRSTLGAIESNQNSWNYQDPGNALAGNGMYFEGDPFSSRSYGDFLIIVNLKPQTPLVNLTNFGPLEAGLTQEIASLIQQDDFAVLHTWISQSGFAHALVLRAKASQSIVDLPVEIGSIQTVARKNEMTPFQRHRVIPADNQFNTLLTEYADHLPLLEQIWIDSSLHERPPDDFVSQAIVAEFNSVAGIRETIYELGSRLNIDPIEVFLLNQVPSQEDLRELAAALKNKKYLSTEDHPSSASELRAEVISHWKKEKGYLALTSIWNWIKTYKKSYALPDLKTTGGDKIIPSVFDAKCPSQTNY